MNFIARSRPPKRSDGGRDDALPVNVPADPSTDWLEKARQAFALRYHEETYDNYENSVNVYEA